MESGVRTDGRGKGGGQKLGREDRAEVKVHFHIPLSAPFAARLANYTKERVHFTADMLIV